MRVISFGPLPPPITGQSYAFKCFVENSIYKPIVVNFSTASKHVFLKQIINLMAILKFIFMVVRFKPKVLYITTSRSKSGFLRDFFIITLSKLFGLKIINHLHGADFNSFRDKSTRLRKLIDFVYSLINVSIVLTDGMKDQYINYPMDIRVVPNFFEESHYLEIPINKGMNDTVTFLYLSNLMASKGILDLLSAFVKLNHHNLKLIIAGSCLSDHILSDLELDKELDKFVGYEHIEFVGNVKGEQKYKLLHDADCLVLPTFYPTEAQPICVIEGMAYGCAIISTEHNYLGELVGVDSGLLVKPQSVAELKEAMETLILNSDLMNSMKKFNFMVTPSRYSKDQYIKNIDSIITDLFDGYS